VNVRQVWRELCYHGRVGRLRIRVCGVKGVPKPSCLQHSVWILVIQILFFYRDMVRTLKKKFLVAVENILLRYTYVICLGPILLRYAY
jgi:hypothetical protein